MKVPMKTLHEIVIVCLASLLLANCHVQKRLYTRGYYVSFSKKSTVAKTQEKHKAERAEVNPDNALTSSVESTMMPLHFFPAHKRLPPDTCADEITFRDGTTQRVKILEISEGTVKYRRCDNLDGPLISKSSENIFSIVYANGFKRVFTVKRAEATPGPVPVQAQAKTNAFAIASFILGLLSILLIPSIFAFVFGIISLVQFDKNPGAYKGKWMAVIGVTLGAIFLGIVLLLVALNVL